MKTTTLQSVKWAGTHLDLLDQRLLPGDIVILALTTAEEVWEAIRHLKVRGAPAIGIAAAYGVVLGARSYVGENRADWLREVERRADYLATSRPTAVNLFWALDRMKRHAAELANGGDKSVSELNEELLAEANRIQAEDEEVCRRIGEHALTLFESGMGVLTHCNAGGLATAKYGTALAPLYLAQERGIRLKVFADETRPVLQGARLTAFELQQAGVDVTLICDNMAGHVMSKGWVQAVIVGTDRVAASGDVANKIGTYSLAVLAKAHGIPFYVACPLSTIDLQTNTGAEIPIEERPESEITEGFGMRTAPQGVRVYNPAFDITPHDYVTAIITERGIVRPSYRENLAKLFES
ncbi:MULTISPECIES: S-methyl-5-thioribose-1-phosphate isomerase [unclassified Paenibacillus]|uniref:S-methyl-5-thioribose-1-phosphate isomerase n=1 Tax=unclassified Paenibacillus TaxID=185978 RepID=UPI001C117A8F|nr:MULTISPECIES: S-methyl-5-thioribose-1-phosphate isomerase [unclassified Paenibacillus]MBU5441546.1 S-methyl-5-thioribose-1-phosphate isomerase [Paenibacillus sp. MSJ-34]CAH0117787.1 5-deoxyribose 1-phosphate isomerase [Paenibacillus sp. CECT 9249]